MKFTDKIIKLRGKYNIIGRSVVIHEDEDDSLKEDIKIVVLQDMQVSV